MVSIESGAQSVDPATRLQQLERFESFFDATTPGPARDRETAEELADWEDEESDLGEQRILLARPAPKYWRVFADTSILYTDNAFLSQEFKRDDFYFTGTVGLQYSRSFQDDFLLSLTARQQFFRYFEFSALDFNAGSLQAGLSYVTPESLGNIILFGRYQWNQLTAARSGPNGLSFGDEFLRYHTFTLGAQRLFFLDPYNYFFAGLSGQFGLTERSRGPRSSDPQKDTYSFFVGYNYIYSRALSTQVGYFLSRNLYDHIRTGTGSKRRDWNHTVSASAIWSFNDYLTAGASASYTWNRSNESFFRYNTGSLGANLELSYRF